jgi:hypothetical protein
MPSRSADTRFAIRKGSVSESGLPLLPHGNRFRRRRAPRMSRLRDSASSRVLCGKRRLHRIRLLQSPAGRAQDQCLRHGIESGARSLSCANCSCACRTHNAQWWIFDLAAFRAFPAVGSANPFHARISASPSSAPGFWYGSATASSSVTPGNVRPIAATGRDSGDRNYKEPPGLRAAWDFPGNFRSAQFLCRVYTKSSFPALPYRLNLLLWSRGELDLGHRGSLHHQQRLRRSGVHLTTEGQ